MAVGTLVSESLKIGARLDAVRLDVTKIWRLDAGDVDVGQPAAWTLIEFHCADDDVDALVEELARALEPALGWYCDLHAAGETIVVFADRWFRYPQHDDQGRAAAVEYARTHGVPDAQLDWPE